MSVRGVRKADEGTDLELHRARGFHPSAEPAIACAMIDAPYRDALGIGVAGNFTGHLEQAGEASDFVDVEAEAHAPKGLFPFYVPGASNRMLGTYPLSSEKLVLPHAEANVQVEPELALVCDVGYDGKRVRSLAPRAFAAYNDASIRRPGARKISDKKNWGPATKGIARLPIPLDGFGVGGRLDRYRLACFLGRGREVFDYGIDSAVSGYSYFNERLIDWVVERLNDQRDEGPLEDVGALVRAAGCPARCVLSVGATRYTEFGESTFVQPGDEAIVAVYDQERYDSRALRDRVRDNPRALYESPGLSLLVQRVEAAPFTPAG